MSFIVFDAIGIERQEDGTLFVRFLFEGQVINTSVTPKIDENTGAVLIAGIEGRIPFVTKGST